MITDKDVLGCALTTLKHQSHSYHAMSEQTGNYSLLREISALMQEKQEQRLRVFQAMNQRGWYNPQLISNQQLQQGKNKMASTQQQLQQQINSMQPSQSNQWHTGPSTVPHSGLQATHTTQQQSTWGEQFQSPTHQR